MFSRIRLPLILILLSGLSLAGYLGASLLTYRIGFPLDDAWIHQTYARNLAWHGEWAFLPGQPSAGSTAPLWSGLLALGDVLRLGPYIWTYLLGWALLAAVAILGVSTFRWLSPTHLGWAPWAGAMLALEWHLVWAAGSGMETLLFAFLVLVVLTWLVRGRVNWLVLGLLVGLSVWVRPDGITLSGPAAFVLLLGKSNWRDRLRAALWFSLGVMLLFGPYLVFNRLLAGAWWPNTFFAKQAEYAVYQHLPLINRLVTQVSLPLVGVGVVLLPGFVLLVWQAVRHHQWGILAGAIWILGYLFLYAWRLPVIYQHGRYVMPAMPAYFLWGLAGMVAWVKWADLKMWVRILGRAWLVSAGLILVIFWGFGAQAYARDVAFIESEMVNTAHWIATNTPPESLVAAHDIGALGYFGQRRLLDLAGLVSPQVIPFIRDEAKLATFLNTQNAKYLVTFPSWYPQLSRQAVLIYQTQGRFSPAMGGENMAVYRWPAP